MPVTVDYYMTLTSPWTYLGSALFAEIARRNDVTVDIRPCKFRTDILHNSNYQSVFGCKEAIDRYFAERNEAFLEHPRRAGNKIWGKERVEAVFREENNCKDPRWR